MEQYGTFILMGLVVLGRFGNFSILGMLISTPMQVLAKAILGL